MDRLAIGEAISAGFRLVSREPLVFAGWIMVEFFVSILLSVLLEATGAASNPAAVLGFLPVVFVLSWLLGAVLAGGVFRAAFTPDDRRALYLRIGPRERGLALSTFGLTVLLLLAAVGVMTALTALLGGAAAAGPGALVAVVALIYAITAGVCVWLFARLGLLLPMSFQGGRFRPAEAWRLSQPQAPRIFAVIAVLASLAGVAYAVIFGTVFAKVSAAIPLAQLNAELQKDPQALAKVLDPNTITAMGLMLLIVSAIARVTLFGAWADIYRQLGLVRSPEAAE